MVTGAWLYCAEWVSLGWEVESDVCRCEMLCASHGSRWRDDTMCRDLISEYRKTGDTGAVRFFLGRRFFCSQGHFAQGVVFTKILDWLGINCQFSLFLGRYPRFYGITAVRLWYQKTCIGAPINTSQIRASFYVALHCRSQQPTDRIWMFPAE